MGLDITFTHRKKLVCPKCGEILGHTDVRYACGSGRAWYEILEQLGYYVPYDKRTEENDWYGKDMVLTTAQAKEVYHFINRKDICCYDDVCGLIAAALFENDCVVINANW